MQITTINTIVELESSLDNVFCALQDHLRDHMQARQYRHLNEHFGAVTDIMAETLQEMRNVQAAEKARYRREKLDALQAGYIELARDMMGDGLPYKQLIPINVAFNEAMAKIRTGIYCIERGIE